MHSTKYNIRERTSCQHSAALIYMYTEYDTVIMHCSSILRVYLLIILAHLAHSSASASRCSERHLWRFNNFIGLYVLAQSEDIRSSGGFKAGRDGDHIPICQKSWKNQTQHWLEKKQNCSAETHDLLMHPTSPLQKKILRPPLARGSWLFHAMTCLAF